MLIGLNGKLKSGKDTTFQMLHDFRKERDLSPLPERISFADKLKDSAAAVLGIDRHTLDEWKNNEDIYYAPRQDFPKGRNFFDDIAIADDISRRYKFTVREFLQRYGTEGHRDIFGDDFWVDMALPKDLDHSHRLLVVTDMRFPNEARRVKELEGITVKVVREVETDHGNHPSEQNIDDLIDLFLDNTGTLDDLRVNVEKLHGMIYSPFVWQPPTRLEVVR